MHEREIDVDPLEFENWKHYWNLGDRSVKNLEQAFPHLDAGDREFLFSGITPEEWALDEINAARAEAGRFGPVQDIEEFSDEQLEFQFNILQRSKIIND